ncbi:hypothetical protein LTR37_001133 [Vermiconidia calcicola]|uniref:Uncharacterized protein n=1 Tax=Vermiconidia calcicola TaxID=1690605 RepID=A0ACC3NZM4_9PEZI|nr:hypothetical protein LTR37_001133 [Vermiconidia calcicola]
MVPSYTEQENELGWPDLVTMAGVPSEDDTAPAHDIPTEHETAQVAEYAGWAEYASSQAQAEGVNERSPGTVEASSPVAPGGLEPFPPPRTSPPLSTPGVHPGPADTSSVASSHPPFQLNPRAPEFDYLRARLISGPPPGTRDPMDNPDERPIGGPMADEYARVRRRRNAIYHMAMVYRRLMAADHDGQAEDLSVHFRRLFGDEYENEVVRVIQEEDDDPPPSEESSNITGF